MRVNIEIKELVMIVNIATSVRPYRCERGLSEAFMFLSVDEHHCTLPTSIRDQILKTEL
jgi:hypothetical protein